MSKEDFKQAVIDLKNSVNPYLSLTASTINYWFDRYFKDYPEERLQKTFDYIAINKLSFDLNSILDTEKEFFGYNLFSEIEKSLEIIKQASKEGIKVSEHKYPKLSTTYPLPKAEAWQITIKKLLN